MQCRRPWSNSWVRKIHWRKDRLPTPVFLGFPGGSNGIEPTCHVRDLGLIPGLGRAPEEGKGYYASIPAWRILWTVVHGVTKIRTRLRDFHSRPICHKCWCFAIFVLPSETSHSLTYCFIFHNLLLLLTLGICLRRYWFFHMSPRCLSSTCFPGFRCNVYQGP